MCCDNDAPPAPLPDPAIGQAASANAQLGREWLDFSREQYKAGNIRQDAYDALIKQVVGSQLATQDQANAWAAEDRQIQEANRKKYDGWADEDRALGRSTKAELDDLAKNTLEIAGGYERTYANAAAKQAEFADAEMGRYNTTFRPVQDKVAKDAMEWDSAERLEGEAGKARADVVSNAARAQEQNARQMASMGVNPNSGRFSGTSRALGLETALAATGAQNVARDNVRNQGIQLRGQAAQLGQQVLANGQQANQISLSAVGAGQQARQVGVTTAMQAKNMGLAAAGIGNTSAGLSVGNQGAGYTGLGVGVNAGSAAIGGMGAGNASFNQNGAGMNAGFGGAMQGYANQGNILNAQFGNQIQGYQAQQQANAQSSAGIGSMIGTIAGAGITAF